MASGTSSGATEDKELLDALYDLLGEAADVLYEHERAAQWHTVVDEANAPTYSYQYFVLKGREQAVRVLFLALEMGSVDAVSFALGRLCHLPDPMEDEGVRSTSPPSAS